MTNVLVIDDDAMIRRMAGFMMKKLRCNALTAASGEEGISLLGSETVGLIIIDVEMPGMNGFETLSKIRENAAFAAIPACMMTGTLDDSVREKAAQLGASDCLEKPLAVPEVQNVLRRNGVI